MKKKKQTWRDRYPYPLFERKVSLTDSAPACLRHNNLIIHSTVPFYRSLTTTVLRSVIDRRTYPVHQPVKEEELSKRKTNVFFFIFVFSRVRDNASDREPSAHRPNEAMLCSFNSVTRFPSLCWKDARKHADPSDSRFDCEFL